jgi:hypothetical protein
MLIVDCSVTDNDNSKPRTGFNDNIIINTKTVVTNLPEGKVLKEYHAVWVLNINIVEPCT